MRAPRDLLLKFFLICLLSLTLTAIAFAASVHFKGRQNFSDLGLTLNVSGELAGLGNGDVTIVISGFAAPTANCANQGGNQAPGQNPAIVAVSGSTVIPDSEIKNGNTPYSVTTNPPVTPIPGAPDCPNPNWTESITDMSFLSPVTVTVSQGGVTVLMANCSFTPSPTANNSGTLDCPK